MLFEILLEIRHLKLIISNLLLYKSFNILLNMKHYLIIQTAFLGDAILTTPLISSLYNTNDDCDIDIICDVRGLPIFETNPYLNRIIVFNKSQNKWLNFIRIVRIIRNENYDCILLPHRSFTSALAARLAKTSCRIGFNKSKFSFLYSNIIKYQQKHEIERNLDLLYPLAKEYKFSHPEIFPLEKEIQKVGSLIKKNGLDDFVAIAPGTKWKTKQWLPEYFKRLALYILLDAELPDKIVIIGGKEDIALCRYISNDKKNIYNFCGKLSIRESYQLIKNAKFIVCNDSASVHLGSAAQIKVVVIYGSTVPEFGFYPYGENHIIIENNNLKCRPCGIHGHQKCPKGHFKCIMEILPEFVYYKIKTSAV